MYEIYAEALKNKFDIKFAQDSEVKEIFIQDPRTAEDFFADETIRGVAFIILANDGEHEGKRGIYYAQGPITHERMRQAACARGGYVPGAKHTNDPNYCFGFYTNKGRFLTRRDTCWLVEENDLPLAIERKDMNCFEGLLSTDIWNITN